MSPSSRRLFRLPTLCRSSKSRDESRRNLVRAKIPTLSSPVMSASSTPKLREISLTKIDAESHSRHQSVEPSMYPNRPTLVFARPIDEKTSHRIAASVNKSLELIAAAAVADGIEALIAVPYFCRGRVDICRQTIFRRQTSRRVSAEKRHSSERHSGIRHGYAVNRLATATHCKSATDLSPNRPAIGTPAN